MPTQKTLREILEYVYSCDVRSDKQDKARIIDHTLSEIKSLLKEKLPETNNLDEAEKELEYDSPELDQMIGWNKCLTEIEKMLEAL